MPTTQGYAVAAAPSRRRDQGRDLLGARVAADDAEEGALLRRRLLLLRHSGMFPCFFAGNEARLDLSSRSERTISIRVSWGAMTASM